LHKIDLMFFVTFILLATNS